MPGEIVDPDGLANQLEGGVVQSASWTLKEEVTFDEHARHERRLGELPDPDVHRSAPEVETVLLDRPGRTVPRRRRGDAGADGRARSRTPSYAAVGVRLRDIPFTPGRVRAAAA